MSRQAPDPVGWLTDGGGMNRYEMMAEPQRDITPEQAAERLRNVRGDKVYREYSEQHAESS